MAARMAPWHLRQYNRRRSQQELRVGGRRVDEFGVKAVSTAGGGVDVSSPSHTQTAHEIFSAVPCNYFDSSYKEGTLFTGPRSVTGMVDGDEVVFELKENVSQRPKTDRTKRFQEKKVVSINSVPSTRHVRFRLWAIQFNIPNLTLIYIGIFLAVNFVFAGFWFIQADKCCGDPEISYLETFDYAIQTSSTIGYGGYVPVGIFSNFLVVVITLIAGKLTAIYSGLLFSQFSAPTAKIQFSDIMTLSNVNGLPCIEIRVGNCDGDCNVLYDISARMSFQYNIKYVDEKGMERSFGQTEELPFLSSKRHELTHVVWTLRHVLDENSPLFGLDLLEYPGNSIFEFRCSLNATQRATGAAVYADNAYEVQDIMIGHRFADQIEYDPVAKKLVCDFAKFNDTEPHFVWYPTAGKPVQVG